MTYLSAGGQRLRRAYDTSRARPVPTLVAAIALIALLAGSLVVIRLSEETTNEALIRLDRQAASEAAAIDDVVGRATRDLRLASRNVAFGDALSIGTGPVNPSDRVRVESAMTYMGDRYAVDEICLIRRDGLEVARFSKGSVAAVADLSPDETNNNPAVTPTLGLADDTAFRTTPYISPDSNRWVLGLATPIVRSGTTLGILHFELPIAAMSDAIAAPFGPTGYSFTIDRTGHLLTHPHIADFRAAAGLSTDIATGDFPPASVQGTADWVVAVDAISHGRLSTGSFSTATGTARFAAYPILGGEAYVVTVSPEAELFTAVRTGQLDLLVTIGPLAVLIVLLTGAYARRLSRANRRLAVAMHTSSELASIVQSAEDAILSVDSEGRVATWNNAAERTFGMTAGLAAGRPLADLVGSDRREEVTRHLATVARGEPVEHYELDLIDASGGRVDLSLTYSPLPGGAGASGGASVIGRDISDLKRLEEELAHQALHDSLTGMPNRALFRDRLDHALHRAHRPVASPLGSRTGVLFIDLDDFKLINDTLGHRIGDALLVAVGTRIASALRPGDTAARLGGDEFTILLENLEDASEARLIADRILAALAPPFHLEGHDVVIGASIGIVLGDMATDDPDDLLRSADTALYEAKGAGKGRHATFDPSMDRKAWQRLELETELRRAIKDGELVVHYQPIVELATGIMTELEALVRWQHPHRGLVGPNDFIPIAEQTGLIVPIGRFVLTTACRQLTEWRRDRADFADVGMSVNMSPRELLRPELVDEVIEILRIAELPADALRIEITEGIELEDAGAIARLGALRDFGVRVSIDDFGTGYSSLGSFRRLPIDGLKIDRSFVAALGEQREETAIVSAAVSFAGALGIGATGEGIETVEQWRALRDLGCRYGQGFLLGRPVAPETIATMDLQLPTPGSSPAAVKPPAVSAA
ncbi:MAG TPA: EAL domain-containing protein [Candidatus Limnocylindrales bacterium]|nr:EAL domain-containing protein [Candidatus Limnocylindrales bacterium]